jgi:7,8-dihydropterin-6-yl-methyl-4-(beta-D-ribofuranosyl)aminobenzene 5'-phosphate synthase
VAGYTGSKDFPVCPGAFDESYNGGPADVFIIKFDNELKTLMSSTFLGGEGNEQGWHNPVLRISDEGIVTIAGVTGSSDFPTTQGAYDNEFNGGENDIFLTKLNNDLSQLLASTYIGGNQGDDISNNLFLSKEGCVYAAGHTFSDDFPVLPGAYKTIKADWCCGFIVKLDRDLRDLKASTYYGGSDFGRGETFIYCMTSDNEGNVFVGGHGFPDFPAGSGTDYEKGGGISDVAYISKFDSTLSHLLASTFIPGNAKKGGEMLFTSLAIDKSGTLFGSGVTSAINFPATPGAYDETINGKSDMFVIKTDTALKSISASTLIGGNETDGWNKIFLDELGNIHVAGYTNSQDFPASSRAFQNKSKNKNWAAFLLKMNKDLSSEGFSKIHELAKRGDLGSIKELVSKNPALAESEDKYARTPLHWTCRYGHTATAKYLLGKGAPIDAQDESANTPAHLAALFNRKDILDLLISQKADLKRGNENKCTPLHLAAQCGSLDAIDILLANNAQIDCKDENGNTPLYSGALNWHDNVVEYLIKKGAGLNVKNNSGQTPFHQFCGLRGRLKIIKMSAEKGADIHTRDNDNKTTLHTSVETWNKHAAIFLMESGVNHNSQDNQGKTPLHYAVEKGPYFLDLIKKMIEKEADIAIKEKEGKTPLDLAIESNHKEIIELLRVKGAIGGQSTQKSQKASPLKFTILYNNELYRQGTKPDWGFSCLIEGTEKTILFDTGTRPDILLHNVDESGVDLKKVEHIVISHDHQDHTGGLPAVLQRNHEVSVYIPASVSSAIIRRIETKKAEVFRVDGPLEICPHVFTTGEMGGEIKEQSLIIDTDKGLVIVTGCSHQGIVEVLRRAKEIFDRPIHGVFGGFHLGTKSYAEIAEIIRHFKEIGVERCGATHCTGETGAIEMFKKAFGEDYVSMGTGRILEIAKIGK